MSKKDKIWLSPPSLSGKELENIQKVFSQNWISTVGPQINAFEDALEHYIGENKKIVALNSGTSALHLALILAGIEKGDKILCPSFTFVASANPIVYTQAQPIFVDCALHSWNIDPVLLEKAIVEETKKGVKPKALILVHTYGMPAKMDEILSICEQHKITIIEDSAEALGSSYANQKCGTFGKFGVLSFNGNKIITTSGGGALVCDTVLDKSKAISLATQAKDEAEHYQHSQLGYNYRLSNVLAAIGIAQLESIEDRVQKKRLINNCYREIIENKAFTFQKEEEKCFSNFWLTAAIADSKKKLMALKNSLTKENIESRPLWKPMHLQPLYKNSNCYLNGNSEHLFEHGICLPSGINMHEEQWERIEKVLRKL